MTKRKSEEGTQFVRYFGPLLDALRKLGGSGTPDEVVEQVAVDLSIPDEVQNELLASREPRSAIALRGPAFTWYAKHYWTLRSVGFGA